MRKIIGAVFFVGIAICGFSQPSEDLPADFLGKDFHKQRRQALRDKLPPNSVAVLFANAVRNRSNDVDYVYHQDPNFYYLTGHKEPDAVLLIFKDKQTANNGAKYDEIIFVQRRDVEDEMWNGRRLGYEGRRTRWLPSDACLVTVH